MNNLSTVRLMTLTRGGKYNPHLFFIYLDVEYITLQLLILS